MQLLATDIPTAESLKLSSHAYDKPDDSLLPPSLSTESSIKRDDWMLEPQLRATTSADKHQVDITGSDEALTEGYGDPSQNTRTLGGSVDFFSTLGSERLKKPQPDRPNPDQVSHSVY